VDVLDGPGGIPIASGLRALEHIATLGAAALGKVPSVKPRSQPQICALWLTAEQAIEAAVHEGLQLVRPLVYTSVGAELERHQPSGVRVGPRVAQER